MFIDLTGQNFGKLTVIKKSEYTKSNEIYWNCKCDCGREMVVDESFLLSEKTNFCRCFQKAQISKSTILRNTKYSPKEASARIAWKDYYKNQNISFDDFYRLSQLPCFYCCVEWSNKVSSFSKIKKSKASKEKLEESYFYYNGLDRIDNTVKDYRLENLVSCCIDCNFSKNDQTLEQFAAKVEQRYLYMKSKGMIT